jgi:hypothetical protein
MMVVLRHKYRDTIVGMLCVYAIIRVVVIQALCSSFAAIVVCNGGEEALLLLQPVAERVVFIAARPCILASRC